jgi:hypothetical protein
MPPENTQTEQQEQIVVFKLLQARHLIRFIQETSTERITSAQSGNIPALLLQPRKNNNNNNKRTTTRHNTKLRFLRGKTKIRIISRERERDTHFFGKSKFDFTSF